MIFFEFLIKFSFGALIAYVAALASKYYDQEKCGFRDGDKYVLCKSQKDTFETDGLGYLPGLLTEAEMIELETMYMKYMNEGSAEKQGSRNQ
jgi:hypothetical protein